MLLKSQGAHSNSLQVNSFSLERKSVSYDIMFIKHSKTSKTFRRLIYRNEIIFCTRESKCQRSTVTIKYVRHPFLYPFVVQKLSNCLSMLILEQAVPKSTPVITFAATSTYQDHSFSSKSVAIRFQWRIFPYLYNFIVQTKWTGCISNYSQNSLHITDRELVNIANNQSFRCISSSKTKERNRMHFQLSL